MKILHLLQSNRFSGAENVVCQIIKAAEKNSDMKMIYCSKDGQIRESVTERGIFFEPLNELSVSEVKRVIREQKPDLIHAHDRSACIIAALAAGELPVIAHMHVNNNKGFSALLKNVIWTAFSKKFRHIFWVSDSAYEQFQFRKSVRKKSTVLYNMIDSNELRKKAEQDHSTYDYDIVYVGRLSYQKDPERLMGVLHKTIQRNTNVKAAVVGTGEYEEYISEYIARHELKNNISYLGYSNNPLKIISDARVMIMTSRFEGTPMVALEAQCLGVPVVSTPVDGMKAVIKDGYNGYLSDDNDELIDKLINIIEDENLCKTLKENSLNSSKAYSDIDKFYGAIAKAYYLNGEEA